MLALCIVLLKGILDNIDDKRAAGKIFENVNSFFENIEISKKDYKPNI